MSLDSSQGGGAPLLLCLSETLSSHHPFPFLPSVHAALAAEIKSNAAAAAAAPPFAPSFQASGSSSLKLLPNSFSIYLSPCQCSPPRTATLAPLPPPPQPPPRAGRRFSASLGFQLSNKSKHRLPSINHMTRTPARRKSLQFHRCFLLTPPQPTSPQTHTHLTILHRIRSQQSAER